MGEAHREGAGPVTDIVEDLRLLQSGAAWVCGETAATLEDAADEIERLREAAEQALWHLGNDADRAAIHARGRSWETDQEKANAMLRAALEEPGHD